GRGHSVRPGRWQAGWRAARRASRRCRACDPRRRSAAPRGCGVVDTQSSRGGWARPGTRPRGGASTLARDVDLARNAFVVDRAAAQRTHAQVAADPAGVDVAGPHGTHVHAAADALEIGIARTDRTDLDPAIHVVQIQVARADAAHARIAADVPCREVAGADRAAVQAADVLQRDITRADGRPDFAADSPRFGVAGADDEAEPGQVTQPGVARADRDLDRHVVGHGSRQVEIGVVVAEERPAFALLEVEANDQAVAFPGLLQLQPRKVVRARGAGASLQVGGSPGLAAKAQLAGADAELDQARIADVEHERLRRAVPARAVVVGQGRGGRCRQGEEGEG